MPEQTGQRVSIIGDGGWGTALALVLHANGHRVRMWGPFPDQVEQARAAGENRLYLPGIALPREIEWTADPAEAAEAEVAVLAVPTRYYRAVLERFAGRFPAGSRFISVSKGLDAASHRRMTELAVEVLGSRRVIALSGPSHAEEVALGVPTAVVAAAFDPADALAAQQLFSGPRFRVYTSEDVAGVEFGGAFKNVIAVAVGMSDGLGFGDNTRAALITRGLAEITRLGTALGARPETFAGLSGMGDLIVTCTSRHSRNRGVGERIGRGETVADVLGSTRSAVEGIWNCALVHALAAARGIEVPVTDEVHAIVHEGRQPLQAVRSLLERELKPE